MRSSTDCVLGQKHVIATLVYVFEECSKIHYLGASCRSGTLDEIHPTRLSHNVERVATFRPKSCWNESSCDNGVNG